MSDLAPFSNTAHNSRSLARQHRADVHQRLGVLTPDRDRTMIHVRDPFARFNAARRERRAEALSVAAD